MTRLGVIMDPIGAIKVSKDSTLAMLLAAQRRGWSLHYMELSDIALRDGRALARSRPLEVWDDPRRWHALGEPEEHPLADLDVVLMRKDPPFDLEYIHATYILERARDEGVLVVNDPHSLRNGNEKLLTAWFPHCAPPTLVSRDRQRLLAFLAEHGDIIVKPLEGMGGASIFRLRSGDPNTNVILETITRLGNRFVMAQRYLPEVRAGDRRILLLDGEPVPWALARIPSEGDHRANLAAGGRGEGVELSDRDRWICDQIGPWLRENGLLFVGIDVIGDFLTEINVTSPTCIRELDALYGLDIAGDLMERITERLS
ncbi:MAG TPA: glutathione synthase [Thiotrichales bacterium]|nr:glutathione synthase [Thiotrichales bacterium]